MRNEDFWSCIGNGRKEVESWNAGCRGERWPGGDNFWFTLFPLPDLPSSYAMPPDSHFLTYTLSRFSRRGLLLQLTFNGVDRETYACRGPLLALSPSSFTSSSLQPFSCSYFSPFPRKPLSTPWTILFYSGQASIPPFFHLEPPILQVHSLQPENLERQQQLVK